MKQLILGNINTGKTYYAVKYADVWANKFSGHKVYIDICSSFENKNLKKEIKKDNDWEYIEESIDLAKSLRINADVDKIILIDNISSWISNVEKKNLNIKKEIDNLIRAINAVNTSIIMIGQEYFLNSRNPDDVNFIAKNNQMILDVSSNSNRVVLMNAGCPMLLRGK